MMVPALVVQEAQNLINAVIAVSDGQDSRHRQTGLGTLRLCGLTMSVYVFLVDSGSEVSQMSGWTTAFDVLARRVERDYLDTPSLGQLSRAQQEESSALISGCIAVIQQSTVSSVPMSTLNATLLRVPLVVVNLRSTPVLVTSEDKSDSDSSEGEGEHSLDSSNTRRLEEFLAGLEEQESTS